jgi:hypothetical protein
MLQGAVLKSAVTKIIAGIFPSVRGESVKTGKRGRPVNSLIGDFADDYLREFPSKVSELLNEQPDLIGGFLDALTANRRPLTDEEAEAIATGRDAETMGLLNGEPTQSDVFNRYSVIRNEGERLGLAFQRRALQVAVYAQSEANESRKVLYMFVERYATDRNLRDAATAEKYGMPLSAVGLMSPNVVAIVVTDNPKAFKGLVARVGTFTPAPKVRAPKVTQEAKDANLEAVPA